MKSRNTLILLVLALGAGAYLWFVDRHKLSTEELLARKGEIIEPERLDRDKVRAVTIRNAEGTFELKKSEGNWSLAAPVADRAESATVSALFTALEAIRGRAVDPSQLTKQSAKEFGVAKGELSVKVAGPKPVEILIGKETAVEGKVYARIEGADTIYTIDKSLRDILSKGIKDWRSRSLSDITPSQISKLLLQTSKGEIELEKQGANWSFTKPFKARGDNQQITDMISNTLTARIDEFVTDSKDLGAFGLAEPRATLTLFAEGEKDPVVLQIGAPKAVKKNEPKKAGEAEDKKDDEKPEPPPAPPTHAYVKLSTRDGVVTVPVAIEALIAKQPNDLRDQSLMRVQSDIVDRITIEPPGKAKIVLGRNGEEWVRKIDGKPDEPVNGGAANKLLNALVNAKVSRMVADLASELKGFGLDQPTTITLSSYSTEGTPETAPGDKPIVKLLLGRFEGDAGYAKLDDEPFIVAVDKALLDDVLTDPVQWQDLKVLDLKKEDITGFEITRIGQPPVAFEHDKEKGWKLAKGDGTVSQNAAGSLLNTISALRAVRWIGATDKVAHGFDKPNLVITYTLADKKTGKLTIGANTPDEMWHAVLDGKPGTFLLNALDFDALNAALIEGEKPAAAATPAKPGEQPPATAATPPVGAPPLGEPKVITPPPAVEPATPPPAVPAPESEKTPEPPKPTEAPAGPASPSPQPPPQ